MCAILCIRDKMGRAIVLDLFSHFWMATRILWDCYHRDSTFHHISYINTSMCQSVKMCTVDHIGTSFKRVFQVRYLDTFCFRGILFLRSLNSLWIDPSVWFFSCMAIDFISNLSNIFLKGESIKIGDIFPGDAKKTASQAWSPLKEDRPHPSWAKTIFNECPGWRCNALWFGVET